MNATKKRLTDEQKRNMLNIIEELIFAKESERTQINFNMDITPVMVTGCNPYNPPGYAGEVVGGKTVIVSIEATIMNEGYEK